MITAPPPSRYKIVEKGGRLLTIDTWNSGEPDAAPPIASALNPAARPALQPPSSTNGRKIFSIITRSSFDDKAPRTINFSLPKMMWWILTHHVKFVLAIVVIIFTFSWMVWFVPLFLIPAIRVAALKPIRSQLTILFDAFDPTMPQP